MVGKYSEAFIVHVHFVASIHLALSRAPESTQEREEMTKRVISLFHTDFHTALYFVLEDDWTAG
jgi:hypothetical protein